MKPGSRFPRMILLVVGPLLLFTLLSLAIRQPAIRTQAANEPPPIFLPLILKPYNFAQPPNPLHMPVRLDPDRATSGQGLVQPEASQSGLELEDNQAVQDTIPVTGGVLTATAADGSLFTLEIPAGALVTDTHILMTPVTAIDGQPLGGNAGAAVQLEPDGLQFLLPVTLTIQPATSIPVTSELTLSWHGDGREFHRYPLALDHPYPQVVFRTMHFSGYSYLGDGISIPVVDDYPIPSNPEDQYKQAVEELVRREREAQADGQPGDPNFHQNIIDLLRGYYNQIIRPIMRAAESDCDYAESGVVGNARGWAQEADQLRAGDELATERQEFDASFRRVLENCWQKHTQPCLNRRDLKQWQAAVSTARLGQELGLDFNLNEVPDCTCSSFWSIPAWELTFTASFNRSAQAADSGGVTEVSVSHEQSGSILLNNKKGWPPYPGWDNRYGVGENMPTGSASIDDTATYYLSDGRQFHNYTTGSGIIGGYAYLEIDELACTYTLDYFVSTRVVDDSFQTEPEERNMYVLGMYALDRNAYTADLSSVVFRGQGKFDAGIGGPYIEHMDLSSGHASHVLFNLFGRDVGYGDVTWTLKPVW